MYDDFEIEGPTVTLAASPATEAEREWDALIRRRRDDRRATERATPDRRETPRG